eukprot:CAMPEP_0197029902 /NCGR_PEP_ID=MMETSP1384-20130603/9250_1 /TAXON_ID=29189 /ORGANISM="Ammonia sp." /LENGTH=218 /DNA_ID=CAMNT_0042459149 /DNA_START=43 /DNA_END=699 /DNA_ORIENTATION=-
MTSNSNRMNSQIVNVNINHLLWMRQSLELKMQVSERHLASLSDRYNTELQKLQNCSNTSRYYSQAMAQMYLEHFQCANTLYQKEKVLHVNLLYLIQQHLQQAPYAPPKSAQTSTSQQPQSPQTIKANAFLDTPPVPTTADDSEGDKHPYAQLIQSPMERAKLNLTGVVSARSPSKTKQAPTPITPATQSVRGTWQYSNSPSIYSEQQAYHDHEYTSKE